MWGMTYINVEYQEGLKPNFYKLPRPWSLWGSSPSRENSHGRTGNRTRNLMVSSQKCWPPSHEAGHLWSVLDNKCLPDQAVTATVWQIVWLLVLWSDTPVVGRRLRTIKGWVVRDVKNMIWKRCLCSWGEASFTALYHHLSGLNENVYKNN
jgi:hypothetical protein